MSSPTILAYLVKKFTNQVENLATDALFYIITQYPQAKDAFIFYINQIGTTIPDNLKFKTQVTWEDNAIPDMVGLNDEDHQVLIIESKFWAYLTPNQPITYINRLPSHPGGIVLFIAPTRRIHGLWIELLQRCAAEGLLSGEPREITPDLFVVEAGRNKFLAVSTWQAILSHIQEALGAASQHNGLSDVYQLQGLCEKIDEDEFQSFSTDSGAQDNDLRSRQYRSVVDDVSKALVDNGIAIIKGYHATPGADYYKRYMTFQGHYNWCVEYNSQYLSRFGSSPIWLSTTNTASEREFLDVLEVQLRPNCQQVGNQFIIPLTPLAGAARSQILSDMVRQALDVSKIIDHH